MAGILDSLKRLFTGGSADTEPDHTHDHDHPHDDGDVSHPHPPAGEPGREGEHAREH